MERGRKGHRDLDSGEREARERREGEIEGSINTSNVSSTSCTLNPVPSILYPKPHTNALSPKP